MLQILLSRVRVTRTSQRPPQQGSRGRKDNDRLLPPRQPDRRQPGRLPDQHHGRHARVPLAGIRRVCSSRLDGVDFIPDGLSRVLSLGSRLAPVQDEDDEEAKHGRGGRQGGPRQSRGIIWVKGRFHLRFCARFRAT
jgi:hypothetical protein